MTATRPPSPPSGTLYTGRRVAPGAPRSDDFTYVVLEPAPAATRAKDSPAKETMAKDRRGEKRTRTRLRDGLVNERRVLVDCRIRDRSKYGARIQLDNDSALPASFVLTDPATSTRFVATLIWQDGRDAGVRLRPMA